jgi:hypothetical protein
MSFTQSTDTKSPFATSTAFDKRGATAYTENWITVTGTAPPVASVKGQGLAVTGISGGYGRLYFANNNYYEQSAAAFFASNQVYVASIDECIASGGSFSQVLSSYSSVDTSRSRTNIFRIGY